MKKQARRTVHAAVLAALYVVLCFLQNALVPGSATWAIQFRAAEALCIFAYFTPAAIPGLTVGCALFNLAFAQALPLDAAVGSLATAVSCAGIWLTRRYTGRFPWQGVMLPALCNGLLVGWELAAFTGGGFRYHALTVAAGELGVMLTLGQLVYALLRRRGADLRLTENNKDGPG